MKNMQIKTYHPADANILAKIFQRAINQIDHTVYSDQQKQAWASGVCDKAAWAQRLLQKKPYIGLIDNEIVGFIELESNGHIDCFYVAPEYQGLGYGSQLYQYIEQIAVKRGMPYLFVQASHIAKPIFMHYGFQVIKVNQVQRNHVMLTHFSMLRLFGKINDKNILSLLK